MKQGDMSRLIVNRLLLGTWIPICGPMPDRRNLVVGTSYIKLTAHGLYSLETFQSCGQITDEVHKELAIGGYTSERALDKSFP